MPQQQDHLEEFGIRATPEGLFEIDSGRMMVFIPRADVLKLSLVHGRLAERPNPQEAATFTRSLKDRFQYP